MIVDKPTKTVVMLSTTAGGIDRLRAKVLARDAGLAEEFRKNKVVEFDGLKIGPDGYAVEEKRS
jgi:hypothetical protein